MCEKCPQDKRQWTFVDIPTHSIKKGGGVEVVAEIRLNSTGEVRRYTCNEILMEDEAEPSVFNWAENNYSCDCNREVFFQRAGGDDRDEDVECTHGRYAVRLVNPVTGKAYYEEF